MKKNIAVLALLVAFSFAGLAQAADSKAKDKDEDSVSVVESGSSDSNLNYIKGREKVLEGKYEEAAPLMEEAVKADAENPLLNHQMAEIYLRLSQYERAEIYAKKAVDKEQKNVDYRATLGGIYASMKKYPEAKEQYAKIMELEPENQKAPLLIGILEAEAGQMEEGIKTLTKAVDSNNDNFMALFYRAKIYLEMEDAKHAKADLDKCLTLRPSFVEAGTALGLLHERLGEIDDAIKVYNRIQGNGRFKKRLAQLYLQKNEFDKALQALTEYEQVEGDDYTARVKIGLILFELKQYDKAAERFQTILKEQPTADNVRFYLGAVFEEMKKFDLSIVEFKKVSKESAFYKEAVLHLGFIYREQGKYKEGIDLAKKLVASQPEVVEFYDMYASFYEQQKDYKKALGVVQDGLKKHASDEKLLYFEGALQDKLGNRDKAIENMRKILTVNANSAHALNFLGYTYAELGQNLDEAETLIRKALSLRPNDGFIEDSLGWVLFKKGKVDEALTHLEKGRELQPDEAVILEHIGDAYISKKDFSKAAEFYKKAVANSKKDKDMAKKLESKLAGLEKDVPRISGGKPRNPTDEDEKKSDDKKSEEKTEKN